MLKSSDVDALYASYGFTKLPCKIQKVNVYGLQTGHFQNADVVSLDVGADADTAKRLFDEIGYACTIRRYTSLREVDESLFKGFFGTESARDRLQKEYDRFCKSLSERLGAPYQYVNARFETNVASGLDSKTVVEALTNSFDEDGPALIVLEAAAGFGKTCTAYEVLRNVLTNSTDKIPILTELSRNRQAKIFKYVLLDEINRNFTGIKLDMVKEQIQIGRIPVIIDGFDELLHKKKEYEDSFEDAEPMLETIGALLHNQAKVLLTTRRTAIFTDNAFFEWLGKQENTFNVVNVKLEKPTVEDWLGYERINKLEESQVPIRHLANPVLLAHLKYVTDGQFDTFCSDPRKIVYSYFETMLEREKSRQELQMTVDEQLGVFKNLTKYMIKEDFTSETREYIQLLIHIENEQLLNAVRSRYARDIRPSVDELATKLSHHALLDRRGGDDYRVGFVNDFILGTFTGEIISCDESGKWFSSEQFIDLAVTAYVPRDTGEKITLWQNLRHVMEYMEKAEQVKLDLMLTSQLQRDLQDDSILGIDFEHCELGSAKLIQNFIFVNCTFTNVIISNAMMQDVTFLNCKLFDCHTLVGRQEPCNIRLVACQGDTESLNQMNLLTTLEIGAEEEEDVLTDYIRSVLERFWPKGRAYYDGRKALRTLYLGVSKSEHRQITEAIEELRRDGLIKIFSGYAELNHENLSSIKEILGRGE